MTLRKEGVHLRMALIAALRAAGMSVHRIVLRGKSYSEVAQEVESVLLDRQRSERSRSPQREAWAVLCACDSAGDAAFAWQRR